MTCPGCDRENDPRRRYCGKCGFNFEPVCRRCSFANAGDDRYCGGCGALLIAKDGCHPRPSPQRPAPQVVAAEGSAPVPQAGDLRRALATRPAAPPIPPPLTVIDELAGLFTPTNHAGISAPLPKIGIDQGDLDKLFGGGS